MIKYIFLPVIIFISFYLISCDDAITPEETRLEGTWTFTFEGNSDIDTSFTLTRAGSSNLGSDAVRYTGTGIINSKNHSIEIHDNIDLNRIIGEISLDSGTNNDIITLDQGIYISASNTINGKYAGNTSGIYASYTTNNYTAAGPP